MNVNEKGNFGLMKVMTDLYEKGYHCFTPFDDFSPVDLIIMDKLGNIKRLQVKYRSLIPSKSKYELAARSMVNGKSIEINKNLIDGWAVYLEEEQKITYLPVSIMDGKGVHYIKPGEVKELW
jgi:PD-(D/E)XK endonuclease